VECEEVGQMLEAYALGAVTPEEAAHIEEHLAECLACWDHLSQSQRAAARLAFAVPLEEPREGLRQRIITQAQREAEPAAEPTQTGRGWRLPRLAAVGATFVALAAVGALSWSLVETHNLRSDYNDVQRQATVTSQRANIATQLVNIVSRPDWESEAMLTSGLAAAAGASAYYLWTRDGKLGAIVCRDLPDPPEGKIYQLWITCGPEPMDGGTFTAWEGQCQHIVSLKCTSPLSGVDVSVEPEGGSASPSDEIVLTASFTR
jgi:anti-sigma-K factor RskA